MRRARGEGQQRDWHEMASEAMERAFAMAPGAARHDAMSKARQLRAAAEMKNWLTTASPAPAAKSPWSDDAS